MRERGRSRARATPVEADAAVPEAATPRAPARPPRSVFAKAASALFLVYLALLSGHQVSIDGLLMQRQALSIVADHSLRFRTPVWTWDGNPMWTSQYGIGQTLLFLPGYLFASPLASSVPVSEQKPKKLGHFYYDMAYADPLYAVGGSWVYAVITALAAFVVAHLAFELGASPRAALWAMAFYGVASPALVYARGDFSQPLAGLCWAAGLLAALRFRDTGRIAWLWGASAIAGYGILSRPFEGLLLVPAVLLVVLPLRPSQWDRRTFGLLLPIGAAIAAAVAVTLLVNFGRYGAFFHFGYTERARWIVPDASTLAAVFVSPARGLLWQFPAVVLAPLAAVVLVRRGRERALGAIALLAVAMLAATAAWHVWWGGWCWGLRLFVPALAPLAALAAVGVDALGARTRRLLPPTLAVAGFAWALPCVLTDSLAGYAKAHDGAAGAWKLSGYPPYGAWQYIRRLTANDPTDIYGVDVLWFRIAHMTDGWSLVVPAVLLALAVVLLARSRRECSRSIRASAAS